MSMCYTEHNIGTSLATLKRFISLHSLSGYRAASVARMEYYRSHKLEMDEECLDFIRSCVANNDTRRDILLKVQRDYDESITMSCLNRGMKKANIVYVDATLQLEDIAEAVYVLGLKHPSFGYRMIYTTLRTVSINQVCVRFLV